MARVMGLLDAAWGAVLAFFSEGVGDAGGRDRLVMARALGSLFSAGAVVGFVSLVLPHESDANVAGIATACVVALVLGIALSFERGRLPEWSFPASCYGASALIALALYYSDAADSPYSFYFVLVAMFVAYFLSL